jgi:hypothetical protein
MLRWYRRLLKLRRELPVLTRGTVTDLQTRDEEGWLQITHRLADTEVTLLFRAGDGSVTVPGLAGKTDLLTDTVFDGTFQGSAALVLV